MSFETLREKRFFSPLIALVRPHGWITKDSSRSAVQRGDVSRSGINAEMGDASLHLSVLLSLSLTLPTAMGFHNSAIKVDVWERLLQSNSGASAVNVSSV